MTDHQVPQRPGWRLDEKSEIKITEIIAAIICERNYRVYAYNICQDHIHMLIRCEDNAVSNMVRLIKGKSAQLYKEYLGKPAQDPFHLWAQKFNKWLVQSDEQLRHTVNIFYTTGKSMACLRTRGCNPLFCCFSLHTRLTKITEADKQNKNSGWRA